MPTRFRLVATAAVLAFGSGPRPVAAQLTGEKFLTKMETIAAYPLMPLSRSDESVVRLGYGLEISFGIGSATRPMTPTERAKRCAGEDMKAEKAARQKGETVVLKCDPTVKFTATSVPTQIRSSNAVADTTFTYTQTPLSITNVSFSATIAQKVSHLLRDDVVPGWQLTGRAVEYPTLTIYGTVRPDWRFSPYFGATFIPGALSNVKIARADTAATVENSAIGGGVSAGVVTQVQNFNLFAELEYSRLIFNTSNWTRPAPLAATTLPDRINIGGARLSIGILFSLKSS